MMKILISGAGIAGPTLAYWLAHYGFQPTLIEAAPRLRTGGGYAEAFQRYQDLFGPFVFKKQKAALRFAGSFAPKSKFALFLRNRIFNLLAVPWIADFALGRDIADKITLPDYASEQQPVQA